MCKYAMKAYKPHYACFECRKTFKRRLQGDLPGGFNKKKDPIAAKCPDCGKLTASMGYDFKSPKKNDVKAWEHLANLYEVGIAFHSCGCNGPGYIPVNSEELIKHLTNTKNEYLKHQTFWASRKEDPENESEVAKDKHKNSNYIRELPAEMKCGTRKKPKYDANLAQKYWNERVTEVQENIDKAKKVNTGFRKLIK